MFIPPKCPKINGNSLFSGGMKSCVIFTVKKGNKEVAFIIHKENNEYGKNEGGDDAVLQVFFQFFPFFFSVALTH